MIDTVIALGAVLVSSDGTSHAPPSAVVGVIVNFSFPDPALPICKACGVTLPPFFMEKLIWPGKLAKNPPEASIVKVTGTVSNLAGLEYSMIVISPVYVPAGRVLDRKSTRLNSSQL